MPYLTHQNVACHLYSLYVLFNAKGGITCKCFEGKDYIVNNSSYISSSMR